MANQVADVYKSNQLAATLTRAGGLVRFEYLRDYSGPPVATTLPKTDNAITTANGATPPFFSGLLPEGARLNAFAKRLKTSPDNELELLIEVGGDPIGDVQVVAEGKLPNENKATVELPRDTSELDFEEMRELYFGSRESGLPGVQDKISSKMLNARARSAEREYIVKFNPTEVPYAVENEYFFLQMARRAGLATGNFELLTDKNGRHALRIERFDRAVDVQTMNKTKFAVEDGAQVLGLYPLEKYDVDFIEMSNKFSGLSGSSLIAAFDLFKQLVFNWLIGNGDAHAKNFSIIQKPAVGFQISPAYDLLCTLYYEDKTMALAVNGSKSGWDRKFLTDAALKLGLNAKVSEKIIDSMITGLASLPDLILDGALPFRRDQNIEVSGLLKKRLAKASN